MGNVFDFINSINATDKPDLFRESKDLTREQAEKDYVPFIVNRGLSYFPDTVLYANEVNQVPFVEKIAQYDFLRLSIRPRTRWSKWFKPEENDDLELIQQVYGYSSEKAAQAMKLLSKEQLAEIRSQRDATGGVMSKKK